MKKGLTIVLLAGAFAAMAMTSGATAGEQPPADRSAVNRGGDGLTIQFQLRSRNGEPVALRRFRFSKLRTPCATGPVIQARGRLPFIKVNDRNRFSESLRRSGKQVRVKGKVSGDLDVVRGKIRAQGHFSPTARNCDSGKVPWVAR